MKIKILFDKETKDSSLKTGWGFSCLIGEEILFDTGENGSWLLNNINNLRISLEKIKKIAISHDHWDHTGGLENILKKRKNLTVYGCPGFSQRFKDKVINLGAELIEVNKLLEITQDIYLTGEIKGSYKQQYIAEQGLIIKTDNGTSLITGCAHPGIINILEKTKEFFPQDGIYLVFGGFHLLNKDKRTLKVIVEKFKQLEVKKVGPTHCTGEEAEESFKESFGDNFIRIKVGQEIEA